MIEITIQDVDRKKTAHLTLPATAKEVREIADIIGRQWRISDIRLPFDEMKPYLQETTLSQLNYLAYRLEELPETERRKFAAVLSADQAGYYIVADMISTVDNLHRFNMAPNVNSEETVGIDTRYGYVIKHDVGWTMGTESIPEPISYAFAGINAVWDEKNAGTLFIYQLRHTDETRDIRWIGYDELRKMGKTPDIRNYVCVYEGELKPGETPDSVYTRFNANHPPGFRGHSLSVSDMIIMNRDGKATAFYVDRFGFQPVSGFRDGKTQPTPRKGKRPKKPER